jgi:hypothetical protein
MINTQGRAHWFGPKGEQRIFEAGEEVPSGWKDHPFAGAPKPKPKVTSVKTKAALDHDGDGEAGGSLPRNVMKLRAIAKKENIDLGDARKAAEIKAVILKARAG